MVRIYAPDEIQDLQLREYATTAAWVALVGEAVGDLEDLLEDAVIDIKNRSFSVVAEVENPDGTAEGILVTLGGQSGGFALVVQEGKPNFHHNFLSPERYTIASSESLPQEPFTIRLDFAYDGELVQAAFLGGI